MQSPQEIKIFPFVSTRRELTRISLLLSVCIRVCMHVSMYELMELFNKKKSKSKAIP
jgi:hypothetical protein